MAGFDFHKRPDERRMVTFGDGRSTVFNEDQASHEEVVVSHWYVWGVALAIGAPSLAIACVSGMFNAMFAWGLGSTYVEKLSWVSASVVFTCFVVGLPAGINLLKATDPKMATIGTRLWYGCIAFSMVSAMGFMANSSDHRNAVTGASIEKREAVRSRITANMATIDRIGTRPPASVVEAEIKAFQIDAGTYRRSKQCTDISRDDTRTACQPLLDLHRKWQEAKSIEAHKAQIRQDRDALDGMPVIGNEVSPQTAIFEWLTGGIVPAHVFDRLLAIFITVLIECGSAFGLAFTASVASTAMLYRRRAFAKAEEQADLVLLPSAAPAMLDAEGAARLWLQKCVGFAAGRSVKSADAYELYRGWLQANELHGMDVSKSILGKLLSDWTVQIGGTVRHSNGTVYEGIAIAEPLLLPSRAAE